MGIANNFITERNNSEVIAVGLNAIREISARCPLAMNADLLGDLVQYKTYKDKAVTYAAKSLIQLFRDKNPQLLHKRMRGKPTEAMFEEEGKVRQFGEVDAKTYVPGAEVIQEEEEDDDDEDEDEESSDDDEEDDDDDDEDEEEDEAPKAKKSKTKAKKGGEERKSEDDEEWVETDNEEEEDDDDEEDEKDKKATSGKVKGVNRQPSLKAKKRKYESEDESDEDDDGGEWVDVSDEDDDEEALAAAATGGEDPATQLMTLEEKEAKAIKISTEKILTQDDFKKIRLEQLKKRITDKNFVKNPLKKRKTINIDESDGSDDESKAKRFAASFSFALVFFSLQ